MKNSNVIQVECMDEIFDTTKLGYKVLGHYLLACRTSYPDREQTNEIFRIIHTLKALINWLNLENPARLMIYMEDVLYMLREQTLNEKDGYLPWLESAYVDFEHFYELIHAEATINELAEFTFSVKKFEKKESNAHDNKLSHLRVLYVEDDPEIQAPLAKFLKRRVKELYLASDGAQGLDSYHIHNPDIIITDINMPNIHGLKLADEIRKHSPNIPIIITSAHNEKPFQYQANMLHINGYLVKPFDFEDLEMQIACCFLYSSIDV